jgi:ABC-type transporter lipoprotein component MlaA
LFASTTWLGDLQSVSFFPKELKSGSDDGIGLKFCIRIVLMVALACGLGAGCAVQSGSVDRAPKAGGSVSNNAERVVLPESVPDPLEPVNRLVWGFNKAVLKGAVKPTAKVYRFFVVKPLRTGIGNFGRNITYPGRLINNLLQGKWGGARDETQRFFFNTVGGLGGFIDVAAEAKLPKSDADWAEQRTGCGWFRRGHGSQSPDVCGAVRF